jgi:hypothetical protein
VDFKAAQKLLNQIRIDGTTSDPAFRLLEMMFLHMRQEATTLTGKSKNPFAEAQRILDEVSETEMGKELPNTVREPKKPKSEE